VTVLAGQMSRRVALPGRLASVGGTSCLGGWLQVQWGVFIHRDDLHGVAYLLYYTAARSLSATSHTRTGSFSATAGYRTSTQATHQLLLFIFQEHQDIASFEIEFLGEVPWIAATGQYGIAATRPSDGASQGQPSSLPTLERAYWHP
jgi:hypothetical protein